MFRLLAWAMVFAFHGLALERWGSSHSRRHVETPVLARDAAGGDRGALSRPIPGCPVEIAVGALYSMILGQTPPPSVSACVASALSLPSAIRGADLIFNVNAYAWSPGIQSPCLGPASTVPVTSSSGSRTAA